jgi:hypothetical protein
MGTKKTAKEQLEEITTIASEADADDEFAAQMARKELLALRTYRMVLPAIGSPETSNGKRIAREYDGLIGGALPVVQAPKNLAAIRAGLMEQFPAAYSLIDGMLMDIARRQSLGEGGVWLRPTIIDGPPGTGKSRFARQLLTALGLPVETVSVASAHDDTLMGISRAWSTGTPSIVLDAISRHQVANPAIVLDEVDKMAEGKQNGSLVDRLLPLLEPSEAARWHEPYVAAPMDASLITWVMTTNDVKLVPAALRSRCRILRMPVMTADEAAHTAGRMVTDLAEEMGLDPRWLPPLDGYELDILRRTWPRHRDLRVLRRLVEHLLDGRSMPSC